ncbi:MAG: DUF1573 domain-containing protein [Alistipes sp.]|nr:DUF1573 domain-containing protein [Alistipes sp.]
MMYWVALVWGFLMPCLATAQIRIIPQTTRDSINNPSLVAAAPIHFIGGATINFGTLSEEAEPWQGEVRWRNADQKPVVITRITSSCGCLRVAYERQPVQPNQEGVLRLTYHPKGHPGAVYQRLFIYTQLSATRPTAILTLRGVVTPSEAISATYPEAIGALRLRTLRVRANRNERSWRIACYNTSDEPLHVALDTLLTPRGWALESDPMPIAPNSAADLVIRCTEQAATNVPHEVRLYLGGVALPPRHRMLSIVFEDEN